MPTGSCSSDYSTCLPNEQNNNTSLSRDSDIRVGQESIDQSFLASETTLSETNCTINMLDKNLEAILDNEEVIIDCTDCIIDADDNSVCEPKNVSNESTSYRQINEFTNSKITQQFITEAMKILVLSKLIIKNE